MTQFVACKFKPTQTRSYTYRNDGEPVSVGDEVLVDGRHGKSRVTVAEIVDEPPFVCKPIIGPAPDREPEDA